MVFYNVMIVAKIVAMAFAATPPKVHARMMKKIKNKKVPHFCRTFKF